MNKCPGCGHLSDWHQDGGGTVGGRCRAHKCECLEDMGSTARLEACRKSAENIRQQQEPWRASQPSTRPMPTIIETTGDKARRAAKWQREDLEREIRQAVEDDLRKKQ